MPALSVHVALDASVKAFEEIEKLYHEVYKNLKPTEVGAAVGPDACARISSLYTYTLQNVAKLKALESVINLQGEQNA
jgi:hypothetical protein